jgi:hypothetical protein
MESGLLLTLHARRVVASAFFITWPIYVRKRRPASAYAWIGYLWRITGWSAHPQAYLHSCRQPHHTPTMPTNTLRWMTMHCHFRGWVHQPPVPLLTSRRTTPKPLTSGSREWWEHCPPRTSQHDSRCPHVMHPHPILSAPRPRQPERKSTDERMARMRRWMKGECKPVRRWRHGDLEAALIQVYVTVLLKIRY